MVFPLRRAPAPLGRPVALTLLALALALQVCLSRPTPAAEISSGGPPTICADGSSTVYPITRAVGERFAEKHPGIRLDLEFSGTGGGFKRFCQGETALSNASRPIKDAEKEHCARNGVEFIELTIAYDAICLVTHPENDWIDYLSTDELARLWGPSAQHTVKRWNQIRPAWPALEVHLFGPGTDSGTYDYFTKAILGKEQMSRHDFLASEDDNLLADLIALDPKSLGFFGLGYYRANRDRLRPIAVDDGDPTNGDGPQMPTIENVKAGTYQPLSRPLFLYVSRRAYDRPEVKRFVEVYLEEAPTVVPAEGFIALPAPLYESALERFHERTLGSVFKEGGSHVGLTLDHLMEMDLEQLAEIEISEP